jgi:predicted membrane GTPase involved in stress response
MELTDKQIARQDFVDNSIFELLLSLNPTDKKIDWDIEMISRIRESVASLFADREICSEQEFYPYLKE